jgi:hypothetical protein
MVTYQFGGIDDPELQFGNPAQAHGGIAKIFRLLRQRRGTRLMRRHDDDDTGSAIAVAVAAAGVVLLLFAETCPPKPNLQEAIVGFSADVAFSFVLFVSICFVLPCFVLLCVCFVLFCLLCFVHL